jgi:glucosyl-dolichyl phosphate glucuronosyltransferase
VAVPETALSDVPAAETSVGDLPWSDGLLSAADISVVVCAYTLDRWEDIVAAVRSLRDQSPPVCELILVSDHNDALRQRAEAELTGVRVIENADVRGLSGARNTGLRAATGHIVAFLDDDAAAEADWARELAAGYADASVIGVGGVSEPAWIAGRPAWFPAEFDWVVGCSYRGLPVETAAVRNMIGSNMSFRREVFAEIGGFDPSVGRVGANPVGCEETELCIRAASRWPRTRIVHEPRARVRHTVPAARGTWRYFRSRCFAEGRSKAQVTRLSGARAGLASERRYTARVLPAGVFRRLAESIRTRRLAPLAAAGAIVAGLGYTAAGYGVGLLFDGRRPRG